MAYKTPEQLKKSISDRHYYEFKLWGSDFKDKAKVQELSKIIAAHPDGVLDYEQDYDHFESIFFSYQVMKSKEEIKKELQELIQFEEEKKKQDKEATKIRKKEIKSMEEAELRRLAKKYPDALR